MGLRGLGSFSSNGRPVRVTLALVLVPAIVACAHAPAPAPAPTNPAGFPFYPGSTLLVARDWRHDLDASERSAMGFLDADQSAYVGHEVVTATPATFDDLSEWLRSLDAHPPDGYRVGLWGSGLDDVRAQARSAGIDFGVFDRDERTGMHDVVVMAVDPDLFQRKAGLMLSALTRFRYLPAFLRGPIDQQAQQQTGFTVSEALDPTTPIGAAVDALGRLDDARARGVIYVDARPAR